MNALEDVISATNWIEGVLGLAFAARHGGARRVWIDRRAWRCPGEAEAELKRLHIPLSGRVVHGDNAGFLVSHRQAAWAEYVLKRFLDGDPVPAWGEAPRPTPAKETQRAGLGVRLRGFW